MLCYKLVIMLVLPSLAPALVAADGSKKEDCKDTKVVNAGNIFSKCLEVTVKNNIEQDNKTCSRPLMDTINDFVTVAKSACYKDDSRNSNDSKNFYDLLQFSLKHYTYKDFVENKGVACIKTIVSKISSCVKSSVVSSNTTKDMTVLLWKNTKWTSNTQYTCPETKHIKDCTLKVMRGEENCNNVNNILYVSSLFEYVLEYCHRINPSWDDHQKDPTNKPDYFGHVLMGKMKLTHILLAVLLAVAVLVTLYVLIRDCRNTEQWKKLSEQIEMKQVSVTQAIRRWSLANKDRIHEH